MLLILEGHSKVGKTSVAKALMQLATDKGYSADIVKFKRTDYPVESMREHMLPLANDNVLHIVDRAHWTEIAMTKASCRKVNWNLGAMIELDLDFYEAGAFVVLLTVTQAEYDKRVRSDGRSPEPYPFILLKNYFEELELISAVDSCVIDVSDISPDEAANLILAEFQENLT